MEDKMAWKRVHTELVENHRMAQDMHSTLTKARSCCAELLSSFTADGNGCFYTDVDERAKDETSKKSEMVTLHVFHERTTFDIY